MSKITAIVNQKGGVGKTTTALNLSYALSEEGKKVLLIDFDPQASLTTALNVDSNKKPNIHTLITQIINEEDLDKNSIINIKENLDLIPSTLDLAAIEMHLVNVISAEFLLKLIIDEIKDKYDNIIIDCSPSLGKLTVNALAASNSVLIPVTPEYLSAKGLEMLADSIRKTKRMLNPQLTIDGILITMVNERTNLAKQMIEVIDSSKDFIKSITGEEAKLFNTIIPISVKTGEAIANKKSIIEYDPKNKVSEAYQYFAWEWGEI